MNIRISRCADCWVGTTLAEHQTAIPKRTYALCRRVVTITCCPRNIHPHSSWRHNLPLIRRVACWTSCCGCGNGRAVVSRYITNHNASSQCAWAYYACRNGYGSGCRTRASCSGYGISACGSCGKRCACTACIPSVSVATACR